MGGDCIVPIGLNTLLDVAIWDSRVGFHMLEKLRVELGFIDTYLDTFRYLFLRFVNIEPLVLFNLFDPKTQVWVRHQYLCDQVFDLFWKEWGQSKVGFEDFLV